MIEPKQYYIKSTSLKNITAPYGTINCYLPVKSVNPYSLDSKPLDLSINNLVPCSTDCKPLDLSKKSFCSEANFNKAKKSRLSIPKLEIVANSKDQNQPHSSYLKRKNRDDLALTIKHTKSSVDLNCRNSNLNRIVDVINNPQIINIKSWDEAISYLTDYKAKYFNIRVPTSYKTSDGFALGKWLSNRRDEYKKGKLLPYKISKLEELGIQWSICDRRISEKIITYLKGDTGVAKSEDQSQSHSSHLKRKYSDDWALTKKDIKSSVGLNCRNSSLNRIVDVINKPQIINIKSWDEVISYLTDYKAKYFNLRVPVSYKTSDGFALGRWISRRRYEYKKGKLLLYKISELEDLGMEWSIYHSKISDKIKIFLKGDVGVAKSKDQSQPHSCHLKRKYSDDWALTKKDIKPSVGLNCRNSSLNGIEDVINQSQGKNIKSWDEAILYLKAYKAKYFDLLVPQRYKTPDGFKLGQWISSRRIDYREGKLSLSKISELENLGVQWSIYDRIISDELITYIKGYNTKYGNVQVPPNYVTQDGFELGRWVRNRQYDYKNGKLSLCQLMILRQLKVIN